MKNRRDEFANHVARQPKSGLSVSEYCRRAGIAYSAFDYWRSKLRREAGSDNGARFVAIASEGSRELTVELKSGARLLLRNVDELRQLLPVLNA